MDSRDRPSEAEDRKRRQAEALRANLARRKQQSRARAEGAGEPPSTEGSARKADDDPAP